MAKLHLEGRVAYHFGNAVRPYVAAVGGFAEMSERFEVPIAETLKGLSPHPTLTAWRASGRWFGGVAIGASVPLSPSQALLVEARSQAFFPGGTLAISPSVGYGIGF
jgi:hypothetical protein